jgi:hypothetical protein
MKNQYVVSVLSGDTVYQKTITADCHDHAIFIAGQLLSGVIPQGITCSLVRPNSNAYNEEALIELHKFHYSFAYGWNG